MSEGEIARTIVFWLHWDQRSVDKTIRQTLRYLEPQPKHKYVEFTGELYVAKPGEVVLAMGKDMLLTMAGAGLVPKNRTVDSLRGKAIQKSAAEGAYMVTYAPKLIEIDSAKIEEIAWDIRLADRYARTGSLKPETGFYRWVDDFSELIHAINCKFEQTGKPVDVSNDTETLGLQPYDGSRIVSLGFTMAAGMADCLYVSDIKTEEHAKRVMGQVGWLLTTDRVKMRGANYKFDLVWFGVAWKLECTNFKFDTLLAGSLIDENRSNSLNNHAKIYTAMGGYDDEFNDKYDKSRMDLVPTHELLQYMGGDIDAVHRTADKIREELLAAPALAHFYTKLLHPAARAFEKVERRGVLADPAKFEELRVELEGKWGNGGAIGDLTKKAISLMPARLRMKYADDLNLKRPALLKDYFFSPLGLNLKPRVVTPKSGEPSTAKSHLSMFADVAEAKEMVTTLEELNSANKTLSTYVHGFLKHLRADNRFHASYMLFAGRMFDNDDDDSGTVTGRLSAKDPPMQTIPKRSKWAKKLRACFPAPPGKQMFSVDFSQGELKLTACLSGDERMLQVYMDGLDLHAVTGSGLEGLDYKEFMKLEKDDPDKFDLVRYKAKAANFGLVYDMQAEGFCRYAWATFKIVFTVDQAQEIIDKFFGTYTGLHPWHARSRNFAKQYGYVVSPLGRVRHLPLINSPDRRASSKAGRQAINSPVQSTLSDLMIWAIALIEAGVPEAEVVAMIHDAAIGYVPEDRAEEIGKTVIDIMSNLPIRETFGWDHQLQFTADLEIGPHMGALKKIKFTKPEVALAA